MDAFLEILNDPLRKQILYCIHSSLIKQVQFFSNCSSVEQCFFISKLKSVLYLPKDIVIREGEQGKNLYFICKSKGDFSVSITDNSKNDEENVASEDNPFKNALKKQKVFAFLREGEIFGEVALLTKLKRTATVVSDDYSTCSFLNKDDVEEMVFNFPHIAKSLRSKLKELKNENMVFRRLMIRNLYYLRDMSDDIINEIICNLQV
jgi:CRP-like cAMP-binding protein